MNEKKTFWQTIKDNKGKIIKGAIVVVGVTAGIIIVKKLMRGNEEMLIDRMANGSIGNQAVMDAWLDFSDKLNIMENTEKAVEILKDATEQIVAN